MASVLLSRSLLLHAGYALGLILLLYLTRPAYLAFRKRRSGYGTVFNSQTGIPEALVAVRLRDLHGQVVRSAVTDRHGRYRILASKGDYIVELSKAGFVFPSAYLGAKSYSPVYGNLLAAAHIIVNDYGVMTKNIPVDPVKRGGASAVFGRTFRLPKRAQMTIAVASPLAALAAAAALRSWEGWSLFAVYAATILMRLFTYKPAKPPYGTVRDADTGVPLQNAIVRIFESRFNKLLETETTSPKGRYAFMVKAGSYYILFQKDGYRGVRLNFPRIQKDGTLLVKDVRMKNLASLKKSDLEKKYGGA